MAGDEAAQREQALAKVREEFLKREITVTGANGETEFTIAKMPATKGWDVLEQIRENAGGALNMQHAGGIESAIQTLVAALPRTFARELRNTMFEYVTFRNRMAVSPMTLAGNEETAFDAIEAEPIAIYEIFLRSLAVGFTPSFVALLEKTSSFLSQISPSPDTGTSPPSSPPQ